jgi:hypothetical protein
MIEQVVRRAQTRLARVAGRLALRRHAWRLLLVAVVVGATRALWLPRPERLPAWAGAPMALLAMITVTVVVTVSLIAWTRRSKRPTALAAARRIDAALDLEEVVASGLAFERTESEAGMPALAKARAERAVRDIDVDRLFSLPRLWPSFKRATLAAAVSLVAVLLGSYDPLLASVLTAPPTEGELDAAAALSEAAEKARPNEHNREKSPAERERQQIADHARAAAKAAASGDRQRALQELGAMRDTAERGKKRAAATDVALRQLAKALDIAKPARSNPQSPKQNDDGSIAKQLSLLSKGLREQEAAGQSPEERGRILERLTRAAERAHERGQPQLSKALKNAAAALSQNDRQKAAQALEEAAARAEALETERREAQAQAEALVEMLESAGELERMVQRALLEQQGKGAGDGDGKDGKSGQGKGGKGDGSGEGERGLRAALARRLSALGLRERGHGPDGSGAHIKDQGNSKRKRLKAGKDEHAPSQVSEGGRAVAAIQGLGNNGEPTEEYRDVYPSYGAVAEEALTDEAVPAARRGAVRRYFEAIRPGSNDEKGSKR